MMAQSFVLQVIIAELLRFKAHNDDKEDSLSFCKPALWRTGFLDAVKNGTIFSRD